MQLRGYQWHTVTECDRLFATGLRAVIAMLPTGGGKTRVVEFMAKRHDVMGGYGIAMAHRSVLIGQLSMALADAGIQHDIIAQKKVVKTIVTKHMKKHGRSYYNPGARWKVASVDTLPGRSAELTSWINKVTLGFTDESHHVVAENKWMRECLRFTHPDMRWILPTATPGRPDGQGLGTPEYGGVGIAQAIVEGPTPQDLIDQGYLTPFHIRGVIPADLDLSDVEVGANGEYNLKQLRKAVHRSKKITGNVVDTYKDNTPGMLGICFAVDIEHAKALTKEFNDKGVKCELITGDDDEDVRDAILDRYKRRETLVLLNVDLFGEGFDLPAIEVVMMARPTASYILYAQQFGRGARLGVDQHYIDTWEQYTVEQRRAIIAMSAKPRFYLHDHVGNVLHFFGPPVKPVEWSLASSSRRSGPSDAIPLRLCLNPKCQQPFERYYTACPYCRTVVPAPPLPTLPAQLDGDIFLYTPEMLARLFGVRTPEEALAVVPDTRLKVTEGMAANQFAVVNAQKNHARKLVAQGKLAQVLPLVLPPSMPTREAQKAFFLRFGVDVVQARMLGGVDTEALLEKINARLT